MPGVTGLNPSIWANYPDTINLKAVNYRSVRHSMANDKSDKSDLKEAMFQVSDGVIGAGVLIVIGVFGGNWLDSKLNTAPWLTVILSMLGGGLGLVRLVKKAMQIGQNAGPSNPSASTY